MPSFLGGDDTWDKVSKEITLLTTALKNCQDGEIRSPPKDDNLQLFQHISTLVTTGEFGGFGNDSTASIVNAVTGRVEADRIIAVVFTCNAIQEKKKGSQYEKITTNNTGKALLEGKNMKDHVSSEIHLQDVVDVISYLLGNDIGEYDIGDTLLFIHRRSFPKLAARVRRSIHLWGGSPIHFLSEHYKERAQSKNPAPVLSASFLLFDSSGAMHNDLALCELTHDPTYISTDGSERYTVDSENVGKWVEFIDSTYRKIERLVFDNVSYGKGLGPKPLSKADAEILVDAIGVLYVILDPTLMSSIFSSEGLEAKLMLKFLAAANEKVLASSSSGTVNSLGMSRRRRLPLINPNPLNVLGAEPISFAWHEAVLTIVDNKARLPTTTKLLVYRVDTLPSRPNILLAEAETFKKAYLASIAKLDQSTRESAAFFLAERAGKGFVDRANGAVVHAEATAMGLICISVLGGECFGNFTKDWMEMALPTSGKISIAVSKKCCWSCAMLASLLTSNLTDGVEFVLTGTHATFFPWIPPLGVPLEILVAMRHKLCVAFDNQARTFLPIPTSPATSQINSRRTVQKRWGTSS